MPINVPRGPSLDEDEELKAIADALRRFEADYPDAVIDLYRHGKYLVKIRVVHPSFKGESVGTRHDRVWGYLADLPDEATAGISTLLPLTPDEKPESYGSMAFDKPHPLPL